MRNDPDLATIAADLRAMLRVDLSTMNTSELLAGQADVERIVQLGQAAQLLYAGEIGARCEGEDSPAKSENFTSAAKLVSVNTGASLKESKKRLVLAARLRGAELLGGVTGPAPFPILSAALRTGELPIDTVDDITRVCTTLQQRGVEREKVASAERLLVEQTIEQGLTVDQTRKAVTQVLALLDPDGAEPRDDYLHEQRFLTYIECADGMVRGKFALTPEQAGIFINAIQALQSPRVAGPRFLTEEEFVTDAIVGDRRSQGQKNADTVIELITRATGAPDMPRLNGASTTVNIHISLDNIEAGRGVGWIDGIEEPVPASTLQQLRCHSLLAATVFGDRGEILHHGKTKRLFTPAQNRALAARDGGCVWPDCNRPPGWCETHHVDEWVSADHPPGRTDIDNGVLLCHQHHRNLHRSSWKLTMKNDTPHIVPPRWIDNEQTPIPTTRRRTHLNPGRRPAA